MAMVNGMFCWLKYNTITLSVRQTSFVSSSAIVSTTSLSNFTQSHCVRLLLRRLTCDFVVDSAVTLLELLFSRGATPT